MPSCSCVAIYELSNLYLNDILLLQLAFLMSFVFIDAKEDTRSQNEYLNMIYERLI